jgi:hypothetical protein
LCTSLRRREKSAGATLRAYEKVFERGSHMNLKY